MLAPSTVQVANSSHAPSFAVFSGLSPRFVPLLRSTSWRNSLSWRWRQASRLRSCSCCQDFEVATFARSCTSHTEAEEMISQLCADSGLVETSSKLLAKASLRLLLSRCRAAEALPSLEQQATPPALAQNSAPQSAATTTTAPRFFGLAGVMASQAEPRENRGFASPL